MTKSFFSHSTIVVIVFTGLMIMPSSSGVIHVYSQQIGPLPPGGAPPGGPSTDGLIQSNAGEHLMLNMTHDKEEGQGYIGTFNVVVNANQTG